MENDAITKEKVDKLAIIRKMKTRVIMPNMNLRFSTSQMVLQTKLPSVVSSGGFNLALQLQVMSVTHCLIVKS